MSGEPPPQLSLEVLGRPGETTCLPDSGTLLLGSSPERAGLVLAAAGVDGSHAVIGRLVDGGWAIKDLGSESGTLLNGKSVRSARLNHGDVLALGAARVRVLDPARRDELVAAAKGSAGSSASPGNGAPPAHLGGFRITQRIGRGGMGEVYLAVQESLNRPVALKVLSARLDADKGFVERFLSEARAAAALTHTNVVVVHDVGEAEGHHYLAMEYMDRGSLEERLAQHGPLEWREALVVLRDAAAGLVFAEERGIVHRDIKPANLMQNAAGATKIADLGLATHVEAEESEDARIYGTPHFISPEQARGEPPDHRSDLYSLGATLYRLLSGRTPFEGETTREILRGHFQDQPLPLTDLVPGIDPELSALIARLLAKDPAARPASAGELLREAGRLLARAEHGAADAGPRRGGLFKLATLLVLTGGAYGVWASGLLDAPTEPTPEPGVGPPPVVRPDPSGPGDTAPVTVGPGTESPEQGPGDDQLLKVRELEARLAYTDLGDITDPHARAEALRELVAAHPGTSTASEAQAEALALESGLQQAATAEALRAAQLERATEALRALADTGSGPPRPGPVLEALRSATPEAFQVDPENFFPAREALELEVVESARAHVAAALEGAEALVAAGQFEAFGARLAELHELLQVPDYAPDPEPANLYELRELQGRIAARLEGLDAERARALDERDRSERQALVQALQAAPGLEAELAALDLAAAAQRVAPLAAAFASPGATAVTERLAADLSAAQRALDLLATSFRAGQWRRKTVTDPRERRSSALDARQVDDSGISVAADGGGLTRIPWSAYGGDVEALDKLYRGRLERDFRSEELADIAALLRLTAVVEVIREADDVLRDAERARFTPGEAQHSAAVHELSVEWSDQAGAGPQARREAAAALELSAALQAASEESWALAEARLEYLLAEFDDSLLVLLLSDGSPPPDDGQRSDPPEGGDAPGPGAPQDGQRRSAPGDAER